MAEGLEHIAHYRIITKLGQGGMGEVYRAVDERLGRPVAIKLLPARRADADNQARLVREAQAAGQLNHPGIVTVHDVGIWRDRVYVVMELVEGKRVSVLAQGGVPPREALDLCLQAARALAVAHRRGILHRDIKPDNLMITGDGRLKVLDFGLAKLGDEAAASLEPYQLPPAVDALVATEVVPGSRPSQPEPAIADTVISYAEPPQRLSPWPTPSGTPPMLLTEVDSLLGTPAYMSPEQASRKPVDVRSEVYSLGLVLYELVTATRPLARESVDATIEAAAAADLKLDELAVPRPVARVLQRALARDRDARYADMDAFADALARAQRQLGGTRRRVLLAAGAAVLGLAAGAGVYAWHARTPAPRAFVVGTTTQLTTGKGCDEAPSFTPDGREVMFDGIVDGDYEIEALATDGAHARRRLTHAPGWDLGPVVSPDGKRVAYVHFTDKAHELRVLGIEGDEHAAPRVIAAIRGFPAWSPDGGLIYGDETGVVWRVDLDRDPRPRELARLPPDHLALSIAALANGELAIAMKLRSSNESKLTLARARPGGVAEPIAGWTLLDSSRIESDRDGKGIYYVTPDGAGNPVLHWRALAGGAAIVAGPRSTAGIAVSARGDRLVLSDCHSQRTIGRLGATGYQPLGVFSPYFPNSFAPLADGSAIVSTFYDSNVPKLMRVYLDGRAERVGDDPANQPSVSPDGTMLAWSAVDPSPPGIRVRALAGGPERRLTESDGDQGPVFSHDGKQVYFARISDAGARVFAVPVTGGQASAVSPTGMNAFTASPVDSRIAAIVVDGDRPRVLVGPPGDLRELPLADRKYSDLVFSADGQHLLVAIDNKELVEVDATRGEPARPVWSSNVDVLDGLVRGPAETWASVSSYEGHLFLVDGTFR